MEEDTTNEDEEDNQELLTPQDAYYIMVKKNEKLNKLREEFNLELI